MKLKINIRIKMKTINGNLILTKDKYFEEDLIVKGNISCMDKKFSLNVNGNLKVDGIIDVGNITAYNIYAKGINSSDILSTEIIINGEVDCLDIKCENIISGNITADNIHVTEDINANFIYGNIIKADRIISSNIHADIIICNKRYKKYMDDSTEARIFIDGVDKLDYKLFLEDKK